MRIGILVSPGATTPRQVQRAEEMGFDSAWFVDSPMIFGDVFVSMAAAAATTSRIELATGVTNPVLRSAPMMAAALGSLAALAPGRVTMGIGTGFTSTAALGLPAAKLADLQRFVEEVRSIVRGEVAAVTMPDGTATHAGFVNARLPWVDVEHPIPVYVASAGPKAIARAATYADGLMLGGVTQPEILAACQEIVASSGVPDGSAGLTLGITPATFVTDRDIDLDEEADFVEMRELLGAKSLAPAITFSRIAEQSPLVPQRVADALVAVRSAYKPPAEDDGDPATRHIRAHRGYMVELSEEQRPLVTREVLRATTICGSPAQCLAQLLRLREQGIGHVVLSVLPQHLDHVLERFGESVLPALVD